jgi:hypothetical protein
LERSWLSNRRRITVEQKTGRGRGYALQPLEGFQNADIAHAAAYMDELRERFYDQIVHLPPEALDYVANGTGLSAGRLGLHVGAAELHVMSSLSKAPESDLTEALAGGSLARFGEAPARSRPAAEIIELCRRVRDEITVPYLRSVTDFNDVVAEDGSTVRGVVAHLQWHWIYHSGHVGLLTFEAGWDYQWTTAGPLAF